MKHKKVTVSLDWAIESLLEIVIHHHKAITDLIKLDKDKDFRLDLLERSIGFAKSVSPPEDKEELKKFLKGFSYRPKPQKDFIDEFTDGKGKRYTTNAVRILKKRYGKKSDLI